MKVRGDDHTLDEANLARAQSLIGLKGYVTNVPVTVMPAVEVIAKYHDLWHVEKSFRMSKSDLRGRPMFHHTRAAIEAHLTIVFTALAISREVQSRTGLSLRRFLRTLKPLRSATIDLNGRTLNVAAASGLGNARVILENIERGTSKYDVIEIMACPGGCINGGGQPYSEERVETIELRMKALYEIDGGKAVRKSHENPSIIRLYEEYLGKPGSHKAHELLHTTYWY